MNKIEKIGDELEEIEKTHRIYYPGLTDGISKEERKKNNTFQKRQ